MMLTSQNDVTAVTKPLCIPGFIMMQKYKILKENEFQGNVWRSGAGNRDGGMKNWDGGEGGIAPTTL